jgi:DNA-directed RNA polymerase subunit L
MNNDPANKRLTDDENYKTSFTLVDVDTCLIIYSRVLSSFLKEIYEDIDNSHPQFNFIVEKGVETISNVFKTILVNTKNVELAEYHTEKACIYYVEFIVQLMVSEINIREAILFVYKKTVFEISTEIRKKSFVSAEQNVYFNIINESTVFLNEVAKFGCCRVVEYARKISFQNELTDVRMSRLSFLNSLATGLSILKCSDVEYFNIIDAVLKKICGTRKLAFSIEKLTTALENHWSPLKTANQMLLT